MLLYNIHYSIIQVPYWNRRPITYTVSLLHYCSTAFNVPENKHIIQWAPAINKVELLFDVYKYVTDKRTLNTAECRRSAVCKIIYIIYIQLSLYLPGPDLPCSSI